MLVRRLDLPLNRDPSTRFMPWMIGFLVYIAALALWGSLTLSDFADQWASGLSGTMTVEVPVQGDEDTRALQQRLEETLTIVRGTSGVESAQALPLIEMQSLLEPWLGSGADIGALPLPRLIDVLLEPGATVDMNALNRRLEAATGARADDHGLWRDQVIGYLRSLQVVALGVVIVVTGAAVIMMIFATRGALFAHRDTIELLHLIGAQDGYIARQFQTHALRLALIGAGIGTVMAMVTVFGLGQAADGLDVANGGQSTGGYLRWFAMAALPFIASLIAMLAARRTVMSALANMA